MHIRQRCTRRTGVRRLLYSSSPALGLLLLLCSARLWASVIAAPPPPGGNLDPTFDGDGIVITNINSYDAGNDLAIQSDGKIVVAGSNTDVATFNAFFTLVRFNVDGSLDSTFDNDGVVSVPQTSSAQPRFANVLALQTDWEIFPELLR